MPCIPGEGVEPSSADPHSAVLPLNDPEAEAERQGNACRTSHMSLLSALPLSYGSGVKEMDPTGIEPATSTLRGYVCSCRWVRRALPRLSALFIFHASSAAGELQSAQVARAGFSHPGDWRKRGGRIRTFLRGNDPRRLPVCMLQSLGAGRNSPAAEYWLFHLLFIFCRGQGAAIARVTEASLL